MANRNIIVRRSGPVLKQQKSTTDRRVSPLRHVNVNKLLTPMSSNRSQNVPRKSKQPQKDQEMSFNRDSPSFAESEESKMQSKNASEIDYDLQIQKARSAWEEAKAKYKEQQIVEDYVLHLRERKKTVTTQLDQCLMDYSGIRNVLQQIRERIKQEKGSKILEQIDAIEQKSVEYAQEEVRWQEHIRQLKNERNNLFSQQKDNKQVPSQRLIQELQKLKNKVLETEDRQRQITNQMEN